MYLEAVKSSLQRLARLPLHPEFRSQENDFGDVISSSSHSATASAPSSASSPDDPSMGHAGGSGEEKGIFRMERGRFRGMCVLATNTVVASTDPRNSVREDSSGGEGSSMMASTRNGKRKNGIRGRPALGETWSYMAGVRFSLFPLSTNPFIPSDLSALPDVSDFPLIDRRDRGGNEEGSSSSSSSSSSGTTSQQEEEEEDISFLFFRRADRRNVDDHDDDDSSIVGREKPNLASAFPFARELRIRDYLGHRYFRTALEVMLAEYPSPTRDLFQQILLSPSQLPRLPPELELRWRRQQMVDRAAGGRGGAGTAEEREGIQNWNFWRGILRHRQRILYAFQEQFRLSRILLCTKHSLSGGLEGRGGFLQLQPAAVFSGFSIIPPSSQAEANPRRRKEQKKQKKMKMMRRDEEVHPSRRKRRKRSHPSQFSEQGREGEEEEERRRKEERESDGDDAHDEDDGGISSLPLPPLRFLNLPPSVVPGSLIRSVHESQMFSGL